MTAAGADRDGENAPQTGDPGQSIAVGNAPEEIAGSLAEFVRCVRTGEASSTPASSNVQSLAMVEAAVRSGTGKRRVELAEVLGGSEESTS